MNKLILPILLIIGVLVISGCAQNGNQTTPDKQSDIFGKYKNSNVAECEKIGDPYERDMCYYDVARPGEGENVCGKIGNSLFKLRDISIRDLCFKNIAIDKAKIPGYSIEAKNICEQIQTSTIKDDCYFDVALGTGDKELCKRFEGSNMSSGCYWGVAIESGEPELCEKVGSPLKDSCYSGVAAKTKNLDLCGKIVNDAQKTGCVNLVNLEKQTT